ncbi:MAG: MFS transporter [Treponema sp.]|jgi:fucose permease|nr:MFS transporter [Treponema sp.]
MAQSKKPAGSRGLLFILYGTMFLFGFLENIKGVSYPLIKNEFDVSYETQGQMISILSLCYTLFVVAAGFILSRFGVKKVYFFGLLCALLSMGSIYFMPGFWLASLSLLLLFAGFGVFEIGVSAIATQIFTVRTALMMNLLHFMYGLGSMAGPKAAGLLVDAAGLGWRQIYLLTAPLVLAIFIPSLFIRFPEAGAGEKPQSAATPQSGETPQRFSAALTNPVVWLFGLTLGLMMGVEMASSNWGSLYFQDVYGMDPATRGANFVFMFFLLFAVSRLVNGFLIEKIGYLKSLFGAVIIAGVIFAAGFALGERGIYVLPLLGFVIAIFWPTLMAVAMAYFGPGAPVMISAVIAAGGLINAAMQFFMGFISDQIGPAWGYRSSLVFITALFCLLFVLRRQIKQRP